VNAGRSGSGDASDRSATGAAGAPGDHGDADTGDEALTGDSVVELPLEDVLDLHGFPPRDVREIVLGYLDDAIAAGFSAVRIVHGRGMGVQRDAVRALLSRDGRVAEFSDAPESQGGCGATLVRFARVAR
jgi:dsDNA-specific endonuclease/ATPase MutS2